MVALYEADAVVDCGDGDLKIGRDAIRRYFTEQVSRGMKFAAGEQRPAIICGDIALTSTKLPDGDVTSEVARRQSTGEWLWIIDKFAVM